MQNKKGVHAVRYYLLIVFLLFFLFATNDFGMLDVQKTAIVMAIGIDRREDDFILTSQIAVPQASTQGKSSQTEQIVSRGKTVAEAFKEINAKTGWYPKLVFCHLLILGEETVKYNAFDALDYFLLDEYLSDNCLVATCEGKAQNLLNVKALIDPSGSLAIQKVLSEQAERVGTVLPCTLREFTIGYYGEARSSYLPILVTQPQQEHIRASAQGGEKENGAENDGQSNDKPVFSASETALFVNGVRVGKLNEEETFAFNAVKKKLRLASYEAQTDGQTCSLNIRRNGKKLSLRLTDENAAVLTVKLTLTAGLLDFSQALPKDKGDVGDVPNGVFAAAEERLAAQVESAFATCRKASCDLFELTSMLHRQEKAKYHALKDGLLQNAAIEVSVRFRNVR